MPGSEETGSIRAGTAKLVGGALCLDFVNTVDWRLAETPGEFLNSYQDLATWSEHAGLISPRTGHSLAREATRRPEDARAVLEQALGLREAIYRVVLAVSHGESPKAEDVQVLNSALSHALAQARVVPTTEGFAWAWNHRDDALDQMLWPIARSAADLLTSGKLPRVSQCADDMCGWLFLDVSRNHSRRWCDMSDCGNRAKARRFYRRTRKS